MKTLDDRPLAVQKPCGGFKRVISRGRKLSSIRYKEYSYWQNMNTRCNNKKYSEKFPTYKGVVMSESFKDYDFFVRWCRDQPEFFKDFWVLDKDLLVPKNKIYGEDTCCFLPPQINGYLTMNRRSSNGLPTGVSWCASEGKYKSYCAKLDGSNKTLGRFSDADSAFKAYVEYKNSLAPLLADTWEGLISERAEEALRGFDVRDYLNN